MSWSGRSAAAGPAGITEFGALVGQNRDVDIGAWRGHIQGELRAEATGNGQRDANPTRHRVPDPERGARARVPAGGRPHLWASAGLRSTASLAPSRRGPHPAGTAASVA